MAQDVSEQTGETTSSGHFGRSGPPETTSAAQPVLAAMAHDECRRLYARIVLGQFAGPETAKERRALERLEALGIVVPDESAVHEPDGELLFRDANIFRALLSRGTGAGRGIEQRFLREGRVDRWPAKESDKIELVRWIFRRCVAEGEEVSEAELNERISAVANDPALVRRYGVDAGILVRDPLTQVYRRA